LAVLAVAALCGLVLTGVGWIRLRRWRQFTAGRQAVLATVVAAGPRALSLRWSAGDAGPVEVEVDAGPAVAARWRALLQQGPPPLEEPDFEDPHGWDTVAVWYDPGGSPPAMLATHVESARTGPSVLITLGVLTVVFASLAAIPSVLLGTIGLTQAIVAALFGAAAIRALRRAQRRPPPRDRRPVTAEVLACTAVALFLGFGAAAAIVAAFA
jgi:hypothetical protein